MFMLPSEICNVHGKVLQLNISVVILTFAMFPVHVESVTGSAAALEMTRCLLDAEMLTATVPTAAGVDG